MKDQKIKDNLLKAYLSYFGIGYFPKAPGTAGSLFTLPLIYFLFSIQTSLWLLIVLIIFLILTSSICAQIIQKKFQIHDPGWIVIDEVIGMLITALFIYPSLNFYDLLGVFILFRVFDIKKIYPATFFDKKVDHGFGTIFDDCISGVYAGLSLITIKYVLTLINT